MPQTPDTECLIATNPKDRDDVYRLRFACYRRDNSIDYTNDERFSDEFDLKPNSCSILVRSAGEALATVRITAVTGRPGWSDSPVTHVYPDNAKLEQIAQEYYVEASRLCFAPQARRGAFLKLVGHMAAMADFHDVRWLVACPREEHAHTYQKLFGFRALAPARQYFGVRFNTRLLAIEREELRKRALADRRMDEAWTEALNNLASAESARTGSGASATTAYALSTMRGLNASAVGSIAGCLQFPVYE
jgi:hypothetical protein